ncbi:helix-turn-helix transcriptional regulator [Streptomyces sp. B1866]|uniref:helix-turn-helix domain-containing protein n=1 Tax=Streptomyces sp. B1866 TaxID=3075431 RepID=UPI00288CB453|nr:helix-turn-helix transcriptional regulator [Streptomyces sp. B1866]MDT3396922.1 helix-turn-helix transcriptional regulator [Streptomyces sp. B1866]
MAKDSGSRELPPSRRAYGEELRLRREAAGHTQQSLGEAVICSPSMIAHIEAGRRKPRPEDAKRLDTALGTDGFFVRFLSTLDSARVAEHFAYAAELEKSAICIQEYACALIPGLLQTEEYARAVFRARKPNVTTDDVDRRAVSRMERGRLLNDLARPEVWSLLDEHVLRRRVGGPAVMAGNLRHVAELAHSGRVRVHVLPFSVGAHALAAGNVTLMRFADMPPVAYLEGVRTGLVEDDPAAVAGYQTGYNLALSEALPQETSLDLIESIAKEYESEP